MELPDYNFYEFKEPLDGDASRGRPWDAPNWVPILLMFLEQISGPSNSATNSEHRRKNWKAFFFGFKC